MDKKKLGALTFLAGLAVGAATTLLNKQNREVVKERATVIKKNTSDLGGKVKEKVKDTVNTIGDSVDINPKDILKSQRKNKQEESTIEIVSSEAVDELIPEQLDVVSEPEKEVAQGNGEDETVEEAEELFEGNGEILTK